MRREHDGGSHVQLPVRLPSARRARGAIAAFVLRQRASASSCRSSRAAVQSRAAVRRTRRSTPTIGNEDADARAALAAPGRRLPEPRSARHHHRRYAAHLSSISCSATARRCATASASAAKASPGRASRRSQRKAEWPDWYPPAEMIARQPYLPRMIAGGPGNPLGARAMYIGGTVYRIHGTNEPTTIGKHVSSRLHPPHQRGRRSTSTAACRSAPR